MDNSQLEAIKQCQEELVERLTFEIVASDARKEKIISRAEKEKCEAAKIEQEKNLEFLKILMGKTPGWSWLLTYCKRNNMGRLAGELEAVEKAAPPKGRAPENDHANLIRDSQDNSKVTTPPRQVYPYRIGPEKTLYNNILQPQKLNEEEINELANLICKFKKGTYCLWRDNHNKYNLTVALRDKVHGYATLSIERTNNEEYMLNPKQQGKKSFGSVEELMKHYNKSRVRQKFPNNSLFVASRHRSCRFQ